MAVTINAKGTSVPYFKIGKSGTTFYQGDADPSNTYTINTNDIWFDTSNGTVKFRVSNAWSGITTASDLTVTGDLTVQGTTTTVNSTEIQVQNTLKFEGSTSNDFETTLTVADPTADRTVTIQNATHTLVGRDTTDTLTNKTINLANNTLSGTLTEFNTAFTTSITDDPTLWNVALGTNSSDALTSGIQNVAMGYNALTNDTIGKNNTAVGAYALQENISGDNNTAMGNQALYENLIGKNNTAVGKWALNTNNGHENTSLGMRAGYSNATGDGNVFLGYKAGYNETGSNKLYIDNSDTSTPLIYGDFATNEVTINGNAKITSTGAITIPVGTTAQRPGTGVVGMLRFNTDADYFEGYNGASWVRLGHTLATGDSHNFGAISETSDVASINYGAITDTDTDNYTYDRGLITDSDIVS